MKKIKIKTASFLLSLAFFCMPAVSQESHSSKVEDAYNLALIQNNNSWINKETIKKAPKEIRKFIVSSGLGALAGISLGALSYFTYSPNTAYLERSAGRDMISISSVTRIFSLTRALTPGGEIDFGFYLLNRPAILMRMQGHYYDIAHQYALGHCIDGAIIGAGIGAVYYLLNTGYKHFKDFSWSDKKRQIDTPQISDMSGN